MKKLGLLIILLILCSLKLNGQIKFFHTFSDSGYDFGQGIVQLEDSSYMVTGTSSSFMEAPSQVFLLKLDKYGDRVWAKDFGGEEADWGRRILNWNDSVFFLTGYTQSSSNGGFDFYFAKTDKNGLLLTEKTYGEEGWEKLRDALITPDSSIVMVGQTSSTDNGNGNFYIVKTDHNGDTLWTRNFGSEGEDILNEVKQLNDTTFYAVGSMYNSDSSMVKAAVIRFYADGEIDWVKQFGANGEYELQDFYFLYSLFYATGSRKHPIDGDQDEYILRMDQDGIVESEQNEHSSGDVRYYGVTQYGNDDQVYIASEYQNEWSAGGSVDVGYTRFNNSLYWNVLAVNVNFILDDSHGEMIPTSDGGAITTGSVASDEFGGIAIYVLKIGPDDDFPTVDLSNSQSLVQLFETESYQGLVLYPNPVNDYLKLSIESTEIDELSIRDIQGKIIYQTKDSGLLVIDAGSWNNGMYFLETVNTDGSVNSYRFIVQH